MLNCLAAGVRFFSRPNSPSGWVNKADKTTTKLSPYPKKLLKMISTNPVFKLILFEKLIEEEASQTSTTAIKGRWLSIGKVV